MSLRKSYSPETVKSAVCMPTIEDRMSSVHKALTATNLLVEGFNAVAAHYGEYSLWENEGYRLYAHTIMEQNKLKAEWKALKKEAKLLRKKEKQQKKKG